MAEPPMLAASSKAAIWHGAVFHAHKRQRLPQRRQGTYPSRSPYQAVRFRVPPCVRPSLKTNGAQERRFRHASDLSNVPPMPTPITSGGHAFAALWRTQSMTSLRIPCLPAPGGSITTREALSDPPPFSSTATAASSFFAEMNIGESGRIVAGVRTIRKTHHAQLSLRRRFGICASNRIIRFHDVARHEHIGTRFKADPARSRILANGDAIALSDFRIFEKLAKNEGAT